VQRFRGGLVFKARRLLYHSTLGWRVIKKKKKKGPPASPAGPLASCFRVESSQGYLAHKKTPTPLGPP